MSRLDRPVGRWSLALSASVAVLGLVALGRRRESRAAERDVRRLLAGNDWPARDRPRDSRDDLPAPVRRYLNAVLTDAGARTRVVRIEQEGELRLGGADSPWRPFAATHHATVGRPGFVWDAAVDLLPFVSARVRDAFVGGNGSAQVSLLGALPIAGASSSPELNEAELQRYLAEAVWYPTALLPRNGVRWTAIDDHTARATLEYGDVTASLVFYFSPEGVVERVHAARRYRRVAGGFEPTPWTGVWREYEDRSGVRVPTVGEVVWHLPDGDFRAWHGRVQEFDRRPSV